MSLLFAVILLLILLAVLLFTTAFNIQFNFDSLRTGMRLTATWLESFLKIELYNRDDGRLMLNVHLLKIPVYNGVVKKKQKTGKKSDGMQMIKAAQPQDIKIAAEYGFSDPFSTGMVTGVLNMLCRVFNINALRISPDFFPVQDYILIDASAKVNVGNAIVNMKKQKLI